MIDPEEVTIDGRVFILSKFPAVAGREIIAGYPLTGIPKIGDYKSNEEIMLKLMSYVGVPRESGGPLRLTTRALVDNHCGSWETLGRIEIEMLKRNCSFFGNGQASSFLTGLVEQAKLLIAQTLTGLSQPSSKAERPRSTN